jgi:hypothetical protein
VHDHEADRRSQADRFGQPRLGRAGLLAKLFDVRRLYPRQDDGRTGRPRGAVLPVLGRR